MLLVVFVCDSGDEEFLAPVCTMKDNANMRYQLSKIEHLFGDAARAGDIAKCTSIARGLRVAERYIKRMRYAYYDAPLVGSSIRLSNFSISYMPIECNNKINLLI